MFFQLMDKRKDNGGKREGSGRKSRTEELELIEQLSPYDKIALDLLVEGVKAKDFKYLKLFLEYRYGKPRETKEIDITTEGDVVSYAIIPV